MRIILFIGLLLVSVFAQGQKINYSIELSYNQPYIGNFEESPDLTPDIPFWTSGTVISSSSSYLKEIYNTKSGGRISGWLTYSLNSKISIEGGLQLNLIRFQQSSGYDLGGTDALILGREWEMDLEALEGNPWGVIYGPIIVNENGEIIYEYYEYTEPKNYDKLGNTSTLYAEFPIILAYSFSNKIKCKIGIIPSFLAYAEVYKRDFNDLQNYLANQIIKDKTADGFTNLLWNGKIGIEYLAFNNVGINFDYVRSLNSVYDEGNSIGKPKYNTFSLGITYHFLNNLD